MTPKIQVTLSVDRSLFRSSSFPVDTIPGDSLKSIPLLPELLLPIKSKSSCDYIQTSSSGDVGLVGAQSPVIRHVSHTTLSRNDEETVLLGKCKQRVTWRSGVPASVSIEEDGSPCPNFPFLADVFMRRLRTSSNHECIDGVYVYPRIDTDEFHLEGDDSKIITY